MTTFTIDTDNNITAFAAAEQVPEGQDRFASEKEFAKLSADWPITRYDRVFKELEENLQLEEPVKTKFLHDNAVKAFKLDA